MTKSKVRLLPANTVRNITLANTVRNITFVEVPFSSFMDE